MKTIQIVIYDPKSDEVFSVGDLELPSKTFDEHQIQPWDAANELLESLGMECCIWSPLHSDEKTEIWQALHVSEKMNAELPSNFEWVPQMLAIEFVDCHSDGRWHRKMMKHNIPNIIADDLVKISTRKKREKIDEEKFHKENE